MFYICSMNAADDSQGLFELGQCACRLGMAFGAEAERAETHERRMEFFHLFDRCFFSMRVATALRLRLRREPLASTMDRREDAAERAEPLETERAERAERETPERYDERDRERDTEREAASLPLLLRTLGAVVADASNLPGPPPAALPALRGLLARATPGPVRTAPATPIRSRLAGSAMAQPFAPPLTRPAPLGIPLVRRSTGPPRR